MQLPKLFSKALMATALFVVAPLASAAANFPSGPIKFVVPFGPGSGTDISARHYAKHLHDLSGQPVIVENRPGGNGFVAVRQVLTAPNDGHTVFIGSNSTLAVNAAVFKELPYDPLVDFAPLSFMMRSPALIMVPGESEHKTLNDFIEAAKANPGKLNYGAGSAGYQLMAEHFNQQAGIDTFHVPFSGGNETMSAVASNVVQLTFTEITSAMPLVTSGKVRALATASEERRPALPDVPTADEAGLSGFTAYTWVAAMVPASTPDDITAKLAGWFTQIGDMDETRAFYENQGAEVGATGPQALREFQERDIELWKRIVKEANIELR